MRHTYPVIMIILVLLTACNKRPKHVLSDSKMTDVLVDIHISEAYMNRPYSGFVSDSSHRVMRQAILRKHGVSQEDFDSTIVWYGYNIEKYTAVYDKVQQRLTDRITKANKQAGNIEEEMDENSLWNMPHMITLSPHTAMSNFSFSIPSDKLQKGDVIEWTMRINRTYSPGTVVLAAEYDKFDTQLVRQVFRDDEKIRVTLQTDSTRLPKRIFGYVSLIERPSNIVWVDSINLYRTPLNPQNYSSINGLRSFNLKKANENRTTPVEADYNPR